MKQFGGTYALAGSAESHSAYSIYPAIHGIHIQQPGTCLILWVPD